MGDAGLPSSGDSKLAGIWIRSGSCVDFAGSEAYSPPCDQSNAVKNPLKTRQAEGRPVCGREYWDEVMTLLPAGHGTASARLPSTWPVFALNKQTETKVYDEF